jgi:hypothetical protein
MDNRYFASVAARNRNQVSTLSAAAAFHHAGEGRYILKRAMPLGQSEGHPPVRSHRREELHRCKK